MKMKIKFNLLVYTLLSIITTLLFIQILNKISLEFIESQFHIPSAHVNYLGFDHIYIINLKRRPERLAWMKYALDSLNANYTVFEAYDYKNESIRSFLERHPLRNGEEVGPERGAFLSSRLSHMRVIELSLEHNFRDVLIFEDDADFDFSAGTMIPLIKKDLPTGWDYLSLYCHEPCESMRVSSLLTYYAPSARIPLFAVARAFSRKGLKTMWRNRYVCRQNLDVCEGLLLQNGELRGYVSGLPLVIDHIENTPELPSDNRPFAKMLPRISVLEHSMYDYYRLTHHIEPAPAPVLPFPHVDSNSTFHKLY